MRPYIAVVHKGADSVLDVSFPDLPGCITAAATLDVARVMAKEALALHLDGLPEDGDAPPEPASLEAVMANREHRDGDVGGTGTRRCVGAAIEPALPLGRSTFS